MSRGRRAARQMNERAASPEGKARAAAMAQCDTCEEWYSTRNTVATELHESGRCK
jgi:hypothetical protein